MISKFRLDQFGEYIDFMDDLPSEDWPTRNPFVFDTLHDCVVLLSTFLFSIPVRCV